MTAHGIVNTPSATDTTWPGGVFKALVALIAVCALSFAFRPGPSVLDRLVVDDAYYCFTVSRNIARGAGVTIDGSTLTNGFQPLFVFLTVPLFALAGRHSFLAIRLVLVLECAFFLGTAFLLGQIVRDFIARDGQPARRLIPWLTALLYVSARLVFLQHLNGLETGCLMFLYAATWRYYQASLRDTHRHYLALGFLLGILVLARIDAVFFVIILCVQQVLWRRGELRLRERAVWFLEMSSASFLVSCPWWAYNVLAFHALMPSSGRAEEAWAITWARWKTIVVGLERVLVPWLYLSETGSDFTFGTVIRSLLLLVLFTIGIRLRRRFAAPLWRFTFGSPERRRTAEFAFCLAASVIVLALWYVLSSWATHYYTRYLTPMALVAVFLVACAWAELGRIIPRYVTVGASALLVVPIMATLISWRVNTAFKGNPWLLQQVGMVTSHVPSGAVVAAGQSGFLGYFRSNVVNLDGKVNPEALAYQSRMWEYLSKVDARWLCDFPTYVQAYLGDHPEQHGWRLVEADDDFVLYNREDAGADR